jgi:hypothetical protein
MRAIDPIANPIAVPIVCGVASRAMQAVCKLMIALSGVSIGTQFLMSG